MSTADQPDPALTTPHLPPGISPVTLRSGDSTLDCFVVPWDSRIFGFAVAQITRVQLGAGTSPAGLFRELDSWCAAEGIRLMACRLDHGQLQESMQLEAHGFRFVEMVYEPRLEALDAVIAPRHAIHVSEARTGDLRAIEDVAYAAFTTGRYLLDHRLPPDLSRRRYASWVRSSVGAPGQSVLKAELDGDLVGFFIVERQPGGLVYWHLTAVAPGWQGRGVGLSLWRTMLRRHAADGAKTVETTISGHNLAALNLYARLGFSFTAARMTFHRLVAPPA